MEETPRNLARSPWVWRSMAAEPRWQTRYRARHLAYLQAMHLSGGAGGWRWRPNSTCGWKGKMCSTRARSVIRPGGTLSHGWMNDDTGAGDCESDALAWSDWVRAVCEARRGHGARLGRAVFSAVDARGVWCGRCSQRSVRAGRGVQHGRCGGVRRGGECRNR